MAEQRLIDANALNFNFDRRCFSELKEGFIQGIDEAMEIIKNAPTVEAVVLPCKVGDIVWWVHGEKFSECKVHRIQINKNGVHLFLRFHGCNKGSLIGAFNILEVGKKIFLSLEEAEETLKERANNYN